jgi:ATP-dependent Clp protease ATP-binding subunit ClpC
MFERFTPRARHSVVLAQEEARSLQHNYVGTEHLLLGIFGEPESIAARVLARFGVTAAQTREDVLAQIGPGQQRLDGHIPFTPRAKKVLELALREALELQHNYIGTEHVLLGLVREGDGVGAQILNARVPEPAAVRLRMAVLDLLPTANAAPRRRWLRRRGSESPPDPSAPAQLDTTPAADTALSEAVQLAAGGPVGSQHLLLAAISDPNSAAARALAELGVDLERARDALRNLEVANTTDEAPEDVGRRMMRIRVTDKAVVIEATDERLVQLGNGVIAALGDRLEEPATIPGTDELASSFANVWRALQESLDDILRRLAIANVVQPPEDESDDE